MLAPKARSSLATFSLMSRATFKSAEASAAATATAALARAMRLFRPRTDFQRRRGSIRLPLDEAIPALGQLFHRDGHLGAVRVHRERNRVAPAGHPHRGFVDGGIAVFAEKVVAVLEVALGRTDVADVEGTGQGAVLALQMEEADRDPLDVQHVLVDLLILGKGESDDVILGGDPDRGRVVAPGGLDHQEGAEDKADDEGPGARREGPAPGPAERSEE